MVESQTAPILARILSDAFIVEAQDKETLSYFAALQIVRVPQFRDRVEEFIADLGRKTFELMVLSRDGFEHALRQASPDRMFTVEEIDQLYAARDPDNYRITANPQAALGHALKVVPRIAELLNRMSWRIMESPGAANFWSSDNPLYYFNPESRHPFMGHGLMAKGTEVNLPIGPRRCLLMAWADFRVPAPVPMEDIRSAQHRGIAGAKRYLFCSTERDAEEALDTHRRLFRSRRSEENTP